MTHDHDQAHEDQHPHTPGNKRVRGKREQERPGELRATERGPEGHDHGPGGHSDAQGGTYAIRRFLRHYRLFFETAAIVAVIALVKLVADRWELEFINVSGLFTSIIAGGVFVLSIILSGVIADFKESEKIPSELTAAIDSIYEDARAIALSHPRIDLNGLRGQLLALVRTLLVAVKSLHPDEALPAIAALSAPLADMEAVGVPANYIVKLRQEQATLRRTLHRLHYIQTIQFLPSAYVLAESIVLLIVTLMVFSKLEPWLDGLILTAFVSYLFIFLLKLIRLVETPFKDEPDRTQDDISMFLLRELETRLEAPCAM